MTFSAMASLAACGEKIRNYVIKCCLWLALVHVAISETTKCLKDDKLKEYPVNVYYCDNPDKPDCCVQDNTPTCCESEADKNLKEQLQLWISVGLLLFVILGVVFCYRKDPHLCGEGPTLRQRLSLACKAGCARCKRRKKHNKVQLSEIDFKSESSIQTTTMMPDDRRVPSGGSDGRQTASSGGSGGVPGRDSDHLLRSTERGPHPPQHPTERRMSRSRSPSTKKQNKT